LAITIKQLFVSIAFFLLAGQTVFAKPLPSLNLQHLKKTFLNGGLILDQTQITGPTAIEEGILVTGSATILFSSFPPNQWYMPKKIVNVIAILSSGTKTSNSYPDGSIWNTSYAHGAGSFTLSEVQTTAAITWTGLIKLEIKSGNSSSYSFSPVVLNSTAGPYYHYNPPQ